ncbi:MAG: hypothetical protein ABR98_04110 [Cryomorphaceae bacterium BACL7 MAG-120910-bin2]|jgi:pantoate--beta-alanine ligase|nr:MAG: hypothetical protein ABR98_04110 [Cryomorphaceae bacterium BACL7 MAG-120910-bin2]KRO68779.1 MAG: hypothetical protein ABR88_00865 [Cryomorphaceae bacterium BACL7 MAG-120322-bin74]KRO83606.1 MAG: hypothetical protein ABR87_03975 [Cryomorphaceae bacterium BACL7 MAG-121220-bin83]
MGALHRGHLALVQQALSECELVIASIFVNPTQFNHVDDFTAYPLDVENDLAALDSIGCHAAFIPNVATLYPDGPVSENYDLLGLDLVLEGALRPGHFQGVATVVDRLFDLIQPDRAYFGLKDYQQVKVIERLATLRGGKPSIVACPIVREDNGLAMSSRNRRLTKAQTREAAVIFEALRFAEAELSWFPVPSLALKREMRAMIQATGSLRVDAIDFALADSLQPVRDPDRPLDRYSEPIQCFVSAFAGDVRLIDTHCIVPKGPIEG